MRFHDLTYLEIRDQIHDTVIASVLTSLGRRGFRRVVVWRGCVGHDLSGVVRRFNAEWEGRCKVCLPALPYADIWCSLEPSVPGGHADSFATSIALSLSPQGVRKDLVPPPELAPVDWNDPQLDFTRYSTSGVIGDPTQATSELGERLWFAVLDRAVSVLLAAATA